MQATFGTISSSVLHAKLRELDILNQNETADNHHLRLQKTVVNGFILSVCSISADLVLACLLAPTSNLLQYSSTTPVKFARYGFVLATMAIFCCTAIASAYVALRVNTKLKLI